MKNLNLLVLFVLFLQPVFGQIDSTQNERSYWSFSPRVGYDFPTLNNDTPYIEYNGGFMSGISIDKYWDWIGVGLDADYLQTKPKSVYPTDNLYDGLGNLLTNFSLSEKRLDRFFVGLGPSFKYQSRSNKFIGEINLRAGMTYINGGRTYLEETTNPLALNFHAGYDTWAFTGKGQLRLNYFLNDNVGIHLGGYYMYHFKVKELEESGISSMHRPFSTDQNTHWLNNQIMERGKTKGHDFYSAGIFAGVTFKINDKKKETQYCDVCGKYHAPPMCACTSCPAESYELAVTAKDKYSNELLANTSVALKNSNNEVVRTAVTNEFGVVTFNDLSPDNYTIAGILYDINLEGSSVNKSEFVKNGVIQKTILYTDINFIIKGKAFECNTNNVLSGTSVYLNGVTENFTKTTATDASGEFILHLPKMGVYTVYGKKNNYMSNIEEINATNYHREKSLFVQLEICATEVSCETLRLDNIHYDRDQYFIRDDAKPELNKVVRFMKDNPTIRIELQSHTDSRATDQYNKTLSQNRAQAAIDYIVSQGVDRGRLEGIGYGESRLLNNCSDGVNCSESEHELNRRTEMRIICP